MATALAWLTAVLVGTVVGLLTRVGFFVGGVVLLRGVALVASAIVGVCPWADPVYTHAAIRSLSDVQVEGIAISGWPGAMLHGALPSVVADPSRARWALLRVVLHPGSALAGRLVAAAIAHSAGLAVGVLLVAVGTRRRRTNLVLAGAAVQVQVALSVLGAQPTVRELESTGASFALNALLPWFWQRGLALSDGLATVSGPWLAAELAGLALLVSYLPAVQHSG